MTRVLSRKNKLNVYNKDKDFNQKYNICDWVGHVCHRICVFKTVAQTPSKKNPLLKPNMIEFEQFDSVLCLVKKVVQPKYFELVQNAV